MNFPTYGLPRDAFQPQHLDTSSLLSPVSFHQCRRHSRIPGFLFCSSVFKSPSPSVVSLMNALEETGTTWEVGVTVWVRKEAAGCFALSPLCLQAGLRVHSGVGLQNYLQVLMSRSLGCAFPPHCLTSSFCLTLAKFCNPRSLARDLVLSYSVHLHISPNQANHPALYPQSSVWWHLQSSL